MSNEIVVTGASGWLGGHTCRVLHRLGWEVVGVSRTPRIARGQHPRWRWIGIGAELEYAVARAGRVLDVGGRLRELIDAGRSSRFEVTDRVARGLSRTTVQDPVLVSASGYRVHRGEELLATPTTKGDLVFGGFDATTEDTAARAAPAARSAIMRIGLVLGADGGVFPVLRRPFDAGHGVVLGSGRQWLPWIHLTDAVGLLVDAISDPGYAGVINAVAPEPARYRDLARATGDVLGVPWGTRVPEDHVVRTFGGASALLLQSHRLRPDTALACNYCFAHPDITGAVEDVLVGSQAAGITSSTHRSPCCRESPCSVTTPLVTGCGTRAACHASPSQTARRATPSASRTWID